MAAPTHRPETGIAHARDGTAPLVSVVIETVTLRESGGHDLVPDLCRAIDAVLAQTYPPERIEILVVFDSDISIDNEEEIRRRYPSVRVVHATAANYFAEKNAGAARASGAIVALVDGDCVPVAEWVAAHVACIENGADGVAGRTRYSGGSLGARTWSVPDFGNVTGDRDGQATGFNLNNVSFRREVLLAHPLNARILRDGGCYLLYHTLRRDGHRIAYAPAALVSHGFDVEGLGFARKHFARGFDGVNVYRCDDEGVLRGTRLVKRFGPFALFPLAARRLALDAVRLVRHRKEVGVPLPALPFFMGVMLTTRTIELAGGLLAFVDPGWRERRERRERRAAAI
jgi:glycosyltransferase involved in cell wall biosynthesis